MADIDWNAARRQLAARLLADREVFTAAVRRIQEAKAATVEPVEKHLVAQPESATTDSKTQADSPLMLAIDRRIREWVNGGH